MTLGRKNRRVQKVQMDENSQNIQKVQTEKRVSFDRKDILLCVSLMVLSAIMSLINLGDTRFPSSAFYGEKDQQIILDFGQSTPLQSVIYLNGESVDQSFDVLYWNEARNTWVLSHTEKTTQTFVWFRFDFGVATRFLMIIPTTQDLSIWEMSFVSDGYYVSPVSVNLAEAGTLFDEPELVPENPRPVNSMYYDEDFHALTAYQFIKGTYPAERAHPPLGKSMIAFGISLFGMTPFGWRIMCVLFGMLIIVPLYVLAKFMFGSRLLAFLTTFVFTFDFMRFVQSRLASLDIFLVTFIICAFLFMYKYIQTSPEDRLNRKALLYLGGSGVFMGLAIDIKWSGVFAALGLGILFAMTWFDARAYYARLYSKGTSGTSEFRYYKKDLARTVMWCVLFFGVVPIAIYCLQYFPYARSTGVSWPVSIIQSQNEIFSHHAYMVGTNDYQSGWWSWPFNTQPIEFVTIVRPDDGTAGGVYAFGSPIVWWVGIPALIWCVKCWFKDKDKTARFLCIAWVAQLLPWAFITRAAYIYHYFPCVPFLVLMIVYFIKTRPLAHQRWFALAYGALALMLFAVFYPVLGGIPIAGSGYLKWLQWLPSWKFVH